MIEIKGKYNEAKIFTDVVDSASIAQVQELCNQEFTAGLSLQAVKSALCPMSMRVKAVPSAPP